MNADIVIDELVSLAYGSLIFREPFIWLFIDDSMTAIPEGLQDTVLDYFNAFHPNLQFTMEMEKNEIITFLDVEVVSVENDELVTNWCTKLTSSCTVINHHLNNPIAHKGVVIKGLFT